MPVLDINEHTLGFGGVFDGLPRDCIQAVHLDHVPALGFGVEAGTALVVLRTLPFHLVFGRNTNPNADALGVCIFTHDHPLVFCNTQNYTH